MKKAYKKPVLLVECFTLSQTIAHNCGENLDFSMGTLKTKESCGWKMGEIVIFKEFPVCQWLLEESDGVCYNAPAGGFNIFQS